MSTHALVPRRQSVRDIVDEGCSIKNTFADFWAQEQVETGEIIQDIDHKVNDDYLDA
jgi:hypothetical protein